MGRKVLVAQFVTESNANIPYKTDLENYDLRFGEDAISQMNMGTVFADAGIEVVPSVYANGFSGGVVTRNAFDYIENRLLNDIRANLGTLDGMFLHLHGASEVEDIGSGDHHILKEVRKLVGPYMPIVVACDPHGNLCKECAAKLSPWFSDRRRTAHPRPGGRQILRPGRTGHRQQRQGEPQDKPCGHGPRCAASAQ